jgi:type IV pilus assembly protein PilF
MKALIQRFAPPALLLLLLGGTVVLGSLGGCASGGPVATASNESFTDSDEPESRKRATNRLRLAVLYFQGGKYNFALDEVKQAINADPGWFEGYNMRGLIYMRTNDFALSESSFQKALSINPGSADLRHNYGVLQCKQGKYAEGMKLFASALATPTYAQKANTWLEQGLCQLASGNKADAEQSFTKSFELDASNPFAAYHLAQLLADRDELLRARFYVRRINNSEAANAESLWLGIKIERRLANSEAVSQLSAQLSKRFPASRQAMALERGAFDE